MTKITNNKIIKNNQQNLLIILILVIIFLGYFSIKLTNEYYSNPERVFWAMINQNLQTGAYEKQNETNYGPQTYSQNIKLQFKGNLVSQTIVQISEKSENNSSKVVTEAIGTPTADYIRYKEITKNNNSDKNSVVNVWAVQTKENSGQEPAVLADALLSTPLMFGYLNSQKRQSIVNQLKQDQVFDIDFSKVDKSYNFNNSEYYAYDVSINLQKYINIYKNYLNDIGQKTLADQLGSAPTESTYQAKLLVNSKSWQPSALIVGDNYDKFTNFDINKQIEIPKNVNKTFEDLKSNLSQS